ncbi:hypothetical protein M422DRAFT_169219, partial [Sphaerobolus stellatus SS14]
WVQFQQSLEQHGYMLRPRYHSGWIASWIGTKKHPANCEKWHCCGVTKCVDAVRISNNRQVMIKAVWAQNLKEVEIGQYLSSSDLASEPGNHCVPILDIFKVPYSDLELIIMPLLRKVDGPPFRTVGEAVALFKRLFEGIQFMHKNHVAQVCVIILMDASEMLPEEFHPTSTMLARDSGTLKIKHYTRTERPPKYYLIDFGLSRKYNPEDGIPSEMRILGAADWPYKFIATKPSNPYLVDVYFMVKLVDDMRQDDPAKRPTIDEVVTRFDGIIRSLSSFKLRSPLIEPEAHPSGFKLWKGAIDYGVHLLFRELPNYLRRLPAIISGPGKI